MSEQINLPELQPLRAEDCWETEVSQIYSFPRMYQIDGADWIKMPLHSMDPVKYDAMVSSSAGEIWMPGNIKDLWQISRLVSTPEEEFDPRSHHLPQLLFWSDELKSTAAKLAEHIEQEKGLYLNSLYQGAVDHIDENEGQLVRLMRKEGTTKTLRAAYICGVALTGMAHEYEDLSDDYAGEVDHLTVELLMQDRNKNVGILPEGYKDEEILVPADMV